MKPSDNIPEGLEYKSEYWDSALNLIKRKEAQLFWFRIIGLAAAVILILGAVYWQVEQKSSVANLFSSTQPEVIASSSPLDQLFSNPEEEARTGAQLNQSSVSMEPNDGLKSNGSVAHEIHQATVTGNLPSGNEPSGHISKSFNSSDPSTSTQIGFETKSSNQFAAEDYTAMNYKATTSTEPLDMELTNLNINETVLLQNKASEFGKNEDTHGQEENIAKANLFEGEELTIKENPANANAEEIEQARKEGNSEASTNGDVDQSYELAKSQNDSQAAEPAGSILENQKSAQGNWSLVPSNLLSKTIQSIPQRHADPGSPIILGNLNSLAQ
ncbi:MAG: hypothetical protein ACPGED_00375, partial [Flavobacteriales bacterium]